LVSESQEEMLRVSSDILIDYIAPLFTSKVIFSMLKKTDMKRVGFVRVIHCILSMGRKCQKSMKERERQEEEL
jgi:hypothetical protein